MPIMLAVMAARTSAASSPSRKTIIAELKIAVPHVIDSAIVSASSFLAGAVAMIQIAPSKNTATASQTTALL